MSRATAAKGRTTGATDRVLHAPCPLCASEPQPLPLVRRGLVPHSESYEGKCRWCGALLLITAMVTKGAA